MAWMCDLDEAKGIDIGSTYRNDKQAKQFIHYIAEVERQDLKELLSKAKYYSIISDGSTDSSVVEAEIVYIRFCVEGEITCRLVGIMHVCKGDAQSITRAINDAVIMYLNLDKDDWTHRLVGMGSDRASVMLGKHNGVAALLKAKQPCMLPVHCYAHRLELAYKDALKGVNMYTSLDKLLMNLYQFYHYSPLNRSALKECFSALGLSPLIPTRVGGTRWLAFLKDALQHLLKGYPAITAHLSQMQVLPGRGEQIAKAKGMLGQLKRHDLIILAHFMLDIVSILVNISLTVQRRNSTIADPYHSLDMAQASLVKYEKRPTPREKQMEGLQEFGHQTLTGTDNIQTTRSAILTNIQKSLSGRFEDCDSQVIKATQIANFAIWPDAEELEDFGDENIRALAKHFKPVLEYCDINTDEIEAEWGLLKAELYRRPGSVHKLTWATINEANCEVGQYRNILSLMDLVLTLPASSAECERGFSQMKLLKSKLRSRLRADHVSDLLTIQLHSREVKEFDPSRAIQMWMIGAGGSRSRRPNTGPVVTRPPRVTPFSESTNDSQSDQDDCDCHQCVSDESDEGPA